MLNSFSNGLFKKLKIFSVESNCISNFVKIKKQNKLGKTILPHIKKPFKLDLSKIDFADDDDFVTEPEEPAVIEDVVEDSEEDEEEPKSISFKNFFKKK